MQMEKKAAISAEIHSNLMSGDSTMVKNGQLAVTEYFRREIRENSIYRQLLVPKAVTKENFDPSEFTDFPSMLLDIAPESAGARMVPFETGPKGNVIHTQKARAEFNRIMTDRYVIDKIRMDTWRMPILDIFYDLMLKDIMDVEDNSWQLRVDECVGTKDTTNSEMGCKRWVSLGALDRAAISHVSDGIRYAPGNLKPAAQIMSDITYNSFYALDHDAVGGTMAQDVFINGVTSTKFNGLDTYVTSKRELINVGDWYVFTFPQYFGGFWTYNDVSMVIKEEDDIWFKVFAHETISGAIVNQAGVCKGTLSGSLTAWV